MSGGYMGVYYVLYFSVPEFTFNKSKMTFKTKTGPIFCFPVFFPLFSDPGYGLWWLGPLMHESPGLLLPGMLGSPHWHFHASVLAADMHTVSFWESCRLGDGLLCH